MPPGGCKSASSTACTCFARASATSAASAALNIAGELEELRARYEQGASVAEDKGAEESARPAAEGARDERRSWFEEIFDGEFAQKRNNDERLSSLVSSRLQRQRPPGGGSDPELAEPEEDR